MGFCKREMEVAALVVIVAMSMVATASAAISCGTVSGDLAPCVGYLTGSGTAPTGGCCAGVKSLYSLTKNSRPDRITSCGCIKSLAAALGNKLNSGNVANLPGRCGVSLGYSISVNTNCNSIP